MWSKDGKQLFYKDLSDDIFVLPDSFNTGGPVIGQVTRLFHAPVTGIGTPFDISRDGKRLLVNLAEDEAVAPLNVVVNWPAQLKRK